jgi:hypothetical protein
VRVRSWPRLLISDGAGEVIETKLQRQLLDRGCKHEVTARGEHHVNDPAEGAIQELETMMRASIHESNIPFKEWCFVVEYMCLIDMMTSYSTSTKSKTIFEDVYGFTSVVESLPVVGCFACRLEETKTRTDKKLGVRNSVGTFVGFDTYRNVYGVVILMGKDTHIVGNLQVVFDSLFMPFKDKPTTNPRLETLYRVLGRVNDRLKANSCNNGTVQVSDSAGNPKNSDEGDSEDEGGLIPDIIQDDNNLDDDDAESSEDDVVDKTVEELEQVLVKVLVFNPLRTEEVRKLKVLPIPTVMKRINAVEDDADEQILEQLGENEVEMRQDEDPVQEVQSSTRTRSPGESLTRSSSSRGDTATLASRIVSSQTSGKPILWLPGVKVKLNVNWKLLRDSEEI